MHIIGRRARSIAHVPWVVLALVVGGIVIVGTEQASGTRDLVRVPAPIGPGGTAQELYTGSHALLIGVSTYDVPSAWAPLESIPGELDQVEAALTGSGFRVERLMNPTGVELRRRVEEFIARYGYTPGNRLLFFFSGHGYTLDKGARGYFVPRDGPDPLRDERTFRATALPMQQVATWAQDLVARHALFSFDSCFSGTIFRTRDRPIPQRITELTAKPVREFMSAGGAGEPVPARSVYTPLFIRGLRGDADLDQDGFVTGIELGNFVQREVIAYRTGQTPQFGKIRDPGLDEGDIVFVVPDLARGSAGGRTPVAVPLARRWAFATRPSDDRVGTVTAQAAALLREQGLGLIFEQASAVANPVWVRPSLVVTSALERRSSGAAGPIGDLPPVRRAAHVNVQELVTKTALGRESTSRLEALRKQLKEAPPADATKRLDAYNRQLTNEFTDAIRQHLEALARGADLDAIFSSADSGLIFASALLEITAPLARMMDGQAPSAPAVPDLRQVAYLDLQRVAAGSALGRRYRQQMNELVQRKASQSDIAALQALLQKSFQQALTPVLNAYCADWQIDLLFSQADAGLLAADPSLDVTDAVIRALDAVQR